MTVKIQFGNDVQLDDLPPDLVISGRGLIHGGFDARQEENSPTTTFSFRKEKVSDVLLKLADNPKTQYVEIDRID